MSVRPSAPAVHDLLRLESLAGLISEAPPPGWVEAAFVATPWVVVRRAPPRAGLIPIGVRGATRDQRWAGWAASAAVTARLSPEALACRRAELAPSRASLPALAALERVNAVLADGERPWGPTGSVGFELATGAPTVTEASDLDLLMRCDRCLPRRDAARLACAIGGLGVRCDLLLETPAGGVALTEYARSDGPVVARGDEGPRLVDDPWAPPRLEGRRP